MIDQCQNPQCARPLHYLREVRIFVFSVDPKDDPTCVSTHRLQHFWLCGCCARCFTLKRTLKGAIWFRSAVNLIESQGIDGTGSFSNSFVSEAFYAKNKPQIRPLSAKLAAKVRR
jgi:hypothetical protein